MTDTVVSFAQPGVSAAQPGEKFALHPGLLLDGRYRLSHVIGRGGMGEVWSAQHLLLDRAVAIKFVLLNAPENALMLLGEAKALASIRDAAVVEVFDCGLLGGAPYLVMEELQGESLGAKLTRDGPMPPEQAVELLLHIARGLEIVHARGIVHRDLKPDNIMLGWTAAPGSMAPLNHTASALRPKLIDFGIADVAVQGTASARLPMGTPPYMSPEQAQYAQVGPKSDVWAFGITLYETVSGTLPFMESENLTNVLHALATSPLPYPRRGPALDKGLWRLLTDCTRKTPEERPSMGDVIGLLESWLTSKKLAFTQPPRPASRAPLQDLHSSAPVDAPAPVPPPLLPGLPMLDDLIRKKLL